MHCVLGGKGTPALHACTLSLVFPLICVTAEKEAVYHVPFEGAPPAQL